MTESQTVEYIESVQSLASSMDSIREFVEVIAFSMEVMSLLAFSFFVRIIMKEIFNV